jgi:hypothetical protein
MSGSLALVRLESQGRDFLLVNGSHADEGPDRVVAPLLTSEHESRAIRIGPSHTASLYSVGRPWTRESREFLEVYRRRLDEGRLSPSESYGAFQGSATCGSCHSDQYQVWLNSGHGNAFATLARVNKEDRPDCFLCHVTTSLSHVRERALLAPPHSETRNVGCESCHGPGREHSANPSTPMLLPTIESCTACHTSVTSPRFDYAAMAREVCCRPRR